MTIYFTQEIVMILRRSSIFATLFCETILSSPVWATVEVNTEYLSGLTGPKVTWEGVSTKGEDTVEIDGKYYKYTYHQPDDYTVADSRVNNTLATADVTNKVFDGLSVSTNGAAIYNVSDNSLVNVKADFVKNNMTGNSAGNGWGVVLYNSGNIGNITGDYIGNYADAGPILSGVIWTQNGEMGDVTGDFIGNYIISSKGASGAGITIYGASSHTKDAIVGDITGNFIGNVIKGAEEVTGGAINLVNYGDYYSIVGDIAGDFIGNYAESNVQARGGAISAGAYMGQKIGNIAGNFMYNHAKAVSGEVYGGALYFKGPEVGVSEGNYVRNYAETVSGNASGGAIHNEDNHIKGVKGDFIGNYTKTGNGQAYGGAITTVDKSDIAIMESDFLNNYAISEKEAYGGAIYTNWTYDEVGYSYIRDLQGAFIGNYAETTGEDGKAYGGAIANMRGGYISMTNTSFVDNHAKGDEAKGGAIYNNGIININAEGEEVAFTGNYIEDEKEKRNEAIYSETLYDTQAELNLAATTGGVIRFDDSIGGNEYTLNITGDGSGEVVFNGKVNGAATFNAGAGSVYHLGKDAVVETGNYTADNATLKLDIAVEGDKVQNGIINVNGDVIGNTKVIVNAENPTVFEGAKTEFVNAKSYEGGKAEQFEVSRVIGSPYMWRSVMNAGGEESGSHWYLSLTDEKNPDFAFVPEVAAYAGLQGAAVEQNRSIAGSVANGLAFKKSTHCYEESCGVAELMPQKQAWIDVSYENAEIDSPADMDAKISGTTIGLDLYRDVAKRAGVFAAYRYGKYDLSGKGKYYTAVGSDITDKGYLGGAYYQYDNDDVRFTGTAYVGKQDMDIKTDDHITKASTDAMQYGASAEVAKKYAFNERVNVEPSLGLYYTMLDVDGLHDNVGKQADFDTLHYLEAELGAKFEYLFCREGCTNRIYAKPSIIRTFTDGGKTKISGLRDDVKSYEDRTLGRMELGGEFGLDKSWNSWVATGYTFGDDYKAYDLTVGLGYRF